MTFDRRYFSRQLVLSDFGAPAQKRLAGSRVLVGGLGGTGSVVATNLCLAGVGSLSLVDRDVVSIENLHRQPIYSLKDVGMAKAEVAAGYLSQRVNGLSVDYSTESLDRNNASKLLDDVDVAVDCFDGMEARLALNAACAAKGVPMVHTGAVGWEASVAAFKASQGACLECVFPEADTRLPSCEEVGVLGAVTSLAGSLGALEAIKLLAGKPSSLLGKMLYFDGKSFEFRLVDLQKRSDCGACGSGAQRSTREAAVRLCGDEEFYFTRGLPPGFVRIFGERADREGESDGRLSDIAQGREGGGVPFQERQCPRQGRALRRRGQQCRSPLPRHRLSGSLPWRRLGRPIRPQT